MHSKKKRILYISPDGILEALGDSQVLKYMEELSKDFIIDLISFEKKHDLANLEKLSLILDRCELNGISWHPSQYRQGVFLFSQIINIFNFLLCPLKIMLNKQSNVIHIRSYMPGLCIPLLSCIFNFKFIFDIRGFWADEKHDRLGWKKKSVKYIFFKRLERYLFDRADAIVTLTHGAKKYIHIEFGKPINKISVIRTCVDFREFNLPEEPLTKPSFTVGYLGTIDTAYDFNKFLYFINEIKKFNIAVEVHLLTKSPREQIEMYLAKNNLQDIKYSIHFLGRNELSSAIVKFDLLAFCLKENFSILASMPTKIGEALACGVPILCNPFNEDIVQIIQSESIGEIYDFVTPFSQQRYEDLLFKIKSKNIAKLCNNFSKKEFSLESGALSYKEIYLGL